MLGHVSSALLAQLWFEFRASRACPARFNRLHVALCAPLRPKPVVEADGIETVEPGARIEAEFPKQRHAVDIVEIHSQEIMTLAKPFGGTKHRRQAARCGDGALFTRELFPPNVILAPAMTVAAVLMNLDHHRATAENIDFIIDG